jgi:hypothetical protein
MSGKANGNPAKLGAAPGRSDRLASATRLIPGRRPTPNPGVVAVREWTGTYPGETADVAGPPWAASAEANAG